MSESSSLGLPSGLFVLTPSLAPAVVASYWLLALKAGPWAALFVFAVFADSEPLSTFLNHVSNFLTNFQFFFFNSTAARYY